MVGSSLGVKGVDLGGELLLQGATDVVASSGQLAFEAVGRAKTEGLGAAGIALKGGAAVTDADEAVALARHAARDVSLLGAVVVFLDEDGEVLGAAVAEEGDAIEGAHDAEVVRSGGHALAVAEAGAPGDEGSQAARGRLNPRQGLEAGADLRRDGSVVDHARLSRLLLVVFDQGYALKRRAVPPSTHQCDDS